MAALKIYGLIREDVLLPYLLTSSSDEVASKFALKYYEDSVASIKDEKEKVLMIASIRQCQFVRLAEIDLVTRDIVKDECLILDLKDFQRKVEQEENGSSTEVSYNV